MKKLTLLTFVVSLSAIVVTLTFLMLRVGAQTYPPCAPMDPQPGSNGAAWPQGATVTVIINPNDFPTESERTKIQDAFLAWQNANTGSGVTFVFTFGTSAPTGPAATNTHYINRQVTQTPGATAISNTGSQTTEGNIVTSARTSIHSDITNSNAIFNILLHEIGHTFGLAHCVECEQGSSIMTAFTVDCFCPISPCDQAVPYNGTRWGCPPLDGPRSCDEESVNRIAHYPAVTPTPTPEPTPCAEDGQSCTFDLDCCPGGKCGELTRTCFPCEPNPQEPQGGCMSEACKECYDNGATYCTGLGGDCWTPIVVDVLGNGFHLTNATNGVNFNDGNGTVLRTAWTAANSDDAWLVLDRNGNGLIDDATELFGNAAPQPVTPGELRNGFKALGEYDKPGNGGNNDGLISSLDTIFNSLRLWQDTNHDGVSAPSELRSFASLDLGSIDLNYKLSKYKDVNNNTFRYRAKLKDNHGFQAGKWVYDVFLDARRAQ